MNTEITAMQELQDIITSRIHDADDELKNKLSFLHSWIVTHGLKKEKEQHINTYRAGDGNAYPEKHDADFAEDYFNETFKK